MKSSSVKVYKGAESQTAEIVACSFLSGIQVKNVMIWSWIVYQLKMQPHPEAAHLTPARLSTVLLGQIEGGGVGYLGQDDAIGQARVSQA